MEKLDDFQRDSLGELINMGMGLAASKLSQLTDAEVTMSVPHVDLVTVKQYLETIATQEDDESLVSVSESFTGGFTGDAVLIFYFNKSMNLVQSLMPSIEGMEELEDAVDDFGELEEEVLTEVGNILINSCISTFANVLKKEFHTDIPRFNKGTADQILKIPAGTDENEYLILLAEVDFSVQSKSISGHVALTLTLPVLRTLLNDLYKVFGIAV